MNLSLLSASLLLVAASAERSILARTRSLRNDHRNLRTTKTATAPRQSAKVSKSMKVAKTFKANSRHAPKPTKRFVPTIKLVNSLRTAKTVKVKSRKAPKSAKLVTLIDESMSYNFDPIGSLPYETIDPSYDVPFSFDFSNDVPFSFDFSEIEYPATTTLPTPVTMYTDLADSTAQDISSLSFFGPAIFGYLSQCADLELAIDTCLVSRTIGIFMNMDDPDEGLGGRMRFLRNSKKNKLRLLDHSDNDGDECGPPDFTSQDVYASMEAANAQCNETSEEEFNMAFYTFMQIFAASSCWESFCNDEDSVISDIFSQIVFSEAASCARVEMDVPGCIMLQIPGIFLEVSQESGCPNENDLNFIVNFVLIEAEATCGDMGINVESTNWSKAVDDLIDVFSSSQCWDMGDCSNPEISTVSFEEDAMEISLVATEDGHQCVFEANTDPELERSLKLSFFYEVETTSANEPSLDHIEQAFVELVCSDARSERVLNESPEETHINALNSSPDDVVSPDYTCLAKTSNNTCFVVEGKATLILEGASTDNDELIQLMVYSKIEDLFASLSGVLDDPNVVGIKYVGQDYPPSDILITSDTTENEPTDVAPANESSDVAPVADEPTIDSVNNGDATGDSESYTALLIATSGGLVAMALLVTGLHKMNQEEATQPIRSDEKSHDGSTDGQSTAYDTAAPTYDGSCGYHSDTSSLPSPARSNGDAPSPRCFVGSPAAKFFILAEEEDENWRELSILPELANDDGTLDGVSEEGSFISCATSSSPASSSEISV